jgi:hypothetical protein
VSFSRYWTAEVSDVLEAIWSMMNPPPHANVGEAFMLHQSLAAFYFLRAKALLYEANCESRELKDWWQKARKDAFDPYIEEHIAIMKKLGVPLPATLPDMTKLNDQFIAQDAAAMVKGMMESHVRGLHSARRLDVAALYRKMLDGALMAGAQLVPMLEKETWVSFPPFYPAGPAQDE